MAVHVPLFIVTSKNILLVHESYGLTRHKLNSVQIFAMIL